MRWGNSFSLDLFYRLAGSLSHGHETLRRREMRQGKMVWLTKTREWNFPEFRTKTEFLDLLPAGNGHNSSFWGRRTASRLWHRHCLIAIRIMYSRLGRISKEDFARTT